MRTLLDYAEGAHASRLHGTAGADLSELTTLTASDVGAAVERRRRALGASPEPLLVPQEWTTNQGGEQ